MQVKTNLAATPGSMQENVQPVNNAKWLRNVAVTLTKLTPSTGLKESQRYKSR